MTTREQIIAAAKQADPGFAGGPDADGTMADSIVGIDAVERFYTIAFGDGAASRDVEIAALRQQLATFHSAVEHVTEDGCTRRSVVAMPEGWAMVHKDRLHELELAEEQLADVRNQVLEECAAIAEDTAAGRDAEEIADAIRATQV